MRRWQAVTFGDCADFQEGYVNPKQGIAGYFDGSIKWLRAVDLNDGVVFSTSRTLTEAGFKSAGKSALLFAPETIAISKSGTIGRVGILKDWMCGNRAVINIKPKHEIIDTRFLFYALKFRNFAIIQRAEGSVQKNLYVSALSSISFDLPPLTEQREIAGILGALDDKIELNRRMAATLEEMARSLYRSWFVNFDPVHAKAAGHPPAHMDPATAALFPDRFGDDGLPEGWVREGLLDQAEWVNGAAYKNMHFSNQPDALPVVKIAELKAGITGNTKFTATDLGAKFRIRRGELLFSWSGNPDTSIDAFIWALGEAWLNQHIFAVRSNGKMSKAMLFSCLRFFNSEMAEIARNKQTTGLGHITRRDLEAFPVCVAPQPIARSFEETIQPLFDRYCGCLYQNQTLATLRDSLLPRLMSGELRVGAARAQVEEVA